MARAPLTVRRLPQPLLPQPLLPRLLSLLLVLTSATLSSRVSAGGASGPSVAPAARTPAALASTTPAAPEAASAAAAFPLLVDDFDSTDGWSARPSDGVELSLHSDAGLHGRSLRLDFHFLKGGGYAVVHRAVSLDLPENYAFAFDLRGECRPNNLEFKLIDSTGENVWWSNQRDFHFPAAWDSVRLKRRHIPFAWGPGGGGTIHHVAAIEFAVTAGSGGQGSVWLDDLTLTPLAAPGARTAPLRARASSEEPGHGSALALDGNPRTFWASRPEDTQPWLELDLGGPREYGGLVLEWVEGRHAIDYVVEARGGPDGGAWRALRDVRGGNGGRDYIYLPESESSELRVRVLRRAGPQGVALRALTLEPLEWSSTREAFFQSIARDARRGHFPRGMSGEQVYWTVVGTDHDTREALLSEDGALETGPGAFSIEPFLRVGSRLITWADVRAVQWLEDGSLPIPSVLWRGRAGDPELTVTAFTAGQRDSSSAVVRYRVHNPGRAAQSATLYLALRPFQVNPPAQFLNTPGGTARIEEIRIAGTEVRVNGTRGVIGVTQPSGFGACTFDQGDVVEYLERGRLPRASRPRDPFGAASGALAYRLNLPPGATRDVYLQVPLHDLPPASSAPGQAAVQAARTSPDWLSPPEAEHAFDSCRRAWHADLNHVLILLPPQASEVERTLRAQLGYMLVTRAGPALQPGTRAYARTWIRDGALMAEALLRLGHPEAVREFLEWFAPYQYENGKVPCCVDSRGADPVPENDSGGEFLFLVAEYYRYTGDRALVERLWPRVARAAAYLDSLRQQRRTAEYRGPGKQEFFGLLPQSISHEGYSAKPMHSYWDDFFALRGFKDAAFLAAALGKEPERERLSAIRDEFQRDLAASLPATMAARRIDYLPGCAELGDFDATSTAIALSPADAAAILPPQALRNTFEKYDRFFQERRTNTSWDAYTPYETRILGTYARLGWRDRIQGLLDFFLASRRPAAWAQWAEVVGRQPRAPRFIGDMPHTWVGAEYARSVLDLLAYERESDSALVVGAGVPRAWLAEGSGVVVRGLPTPFGKLDLDMREEHGVSIVRVAGNLRIPAGGVILPALDPHSPSALIEGSPAKRNYVGEVVLHRLPAEVHFSR